MIARRHMYDFGTTREHLAAVAVKNHANGALNPGCAHAQGHHPGAGHERQAHRRTAESLRLLADQRRRGRRDSGAARTRRANSRTSRCACWASRRRRISWRSTRKPTSPPFPRCGARRRRPTDGRGDGRATSNSPNCTIASPSPKSSPWRIWDSCARGAGRAVRLRRLHQRAHGARPINASGGLKSKGHPVGATGVAQICDLVQQIRCEAGDAQLTRHALGLAQNLGGSGATCVVTILGNDMRTRRGLYRKP